MAIGRAEYRQMAGGDGLGLRPTADRPTGRQADRRMLAYGLWQKRPDGAIGISPGIFGSGTPWRLRRFVRSRAVLRGEAPVPPFAIARAERRALVRRLCRLLRKAARSLNVAVAVWCGVIPASGVKSVRCHTIHTADGFNPKMEAPADLELGKRSAGKMVRDRDTSSQK